MLHTILVPLDGSRLAEQALSETRRLARASDATIVLVRVVRVGTAFQDQWAAQLTGVAEAEDYLRGQARVLSSAGYSVQTGVFCNNPAEGIALAAMVHGANMIMMSTHGRSGLRRAVLGSVAEQVVHDTSIPVLLVRCTSRARRTGLDHAGPYSKILVPLDGTPLAARALRYLAREPFARQATVVLLETVTPTLTPSAEALITTAYVPTPIYVQERSETEHYCAQATHYLYTAALTYLDDRPWDSAVAVGPPAQEIVESSTERGVDLIVMATHRRVGTERLFHGSVAAEVVRHATVPVLLLREVDQSTPDAARAVDETATAAAALK